MIDEAGVGMVRIADASSSAASIAAASTNCAMVGDVTRAGVLLIALMAACDKPSDKCQRAINRLGRIEAAKGRPYPSKTAAWMLDACRTSKSAAHDPVLRCAMDSRTDDAAAACIERGLKDVLNDPAAGTPGSGLNPLLP